MLLSLIDPFLRDGNVKQQWRTVTRWNLWLGTVFAVFTALAGWYAYNTVAHDTPSHAAMTEHRNWALATLFAFLALSAWSFWDARHGRKPGVLFIGLLFAGGLLLASTGWRGGELVYRYGLGVMSLPQPEGEAHDHEHIDGEMHEPNTAAPTGEAEHPSSPTIDQMPREPLTEAPAVPGAKTTAPNQPAISTKPHNSDGHTHDH